MNDHAHANAIRSPVYQDRADAGRELAARLRGHIGEPVLVLGISPSGVAVAYEVAREIQALLERWDGTHAPHRISMRHHTIVLVDDGLASTEEMRAAISAIRQEKPHRLVVALPVATQTLLAHLDPYVDDVVFLRALSSLADVAAAYADSPAPATLDVAGLVDRRRHEHDSLRPPPPR